MLSKFIASLVIAIGFLLSGTIAHADEIEESTPSEVDDNEAPSDNEVDPVEAELEAIQEELHEDPDDENDLDDSDIEEDGVDYDETDPVEAELEALEEELHEDPDDENDLDDSDVEEEGVDQDDADAELEELEDELSTPAETQPDDPLAVPGLRDSTSGAVQSMNPDISMIADFAFAWFSDEPDLVGGHDPVDFGFNLQGLELGIQSAVDPYFQFNSYIVFTLWGVEVEEAYGTTLALPANLQLRAGQYLTNFGRINPTHLHVWNFVTQPLVLGKFFGGEGLRGLGVELSQMLPLPWLAEWYVSVQNIGGSSTGRSWLSTPGDVESLTDLTLTGRLEQYWDLSDSLAMLLGFSGAFGPNDTGRGNRSEVYGADLLLHWNPSGAGGYRTVGWQNEFLLRRRQTPGSADADEGTVLQDFGGLSELYYSPSLFWRFAGRYEFVSGVDDDPLDPHWDEDRQRIAANISYYPSHFSRIRVEYGVDLMPYRDALNEVVHMGMVQLELVVGAHGAHEF